VPGRQEHSHGAQLRDLPPHGPEHYAARAGARSALYQAVSLLISVLFYIERYPLSLVDPGVGARHPPSPRCTALAWRLM
jgi:hypothetical protein